jgi:hypothetical protein
MSLVQELKRTERLTPTNKPTNDKPTNNELSLDSFYKIVTIRQLFSLKCT